MKIFKHLESYRKLARLLIKYGRSDVVEKIGVELPEKQEINQGDATTAAMLVSDLQKLGPTYIKLGQLLSTQFDMLPAAYQEALTQLQDHAETFSFEEVERIFQEELGLKIKDIFEYFNPQPLAAGSLSQVHEAILPSGRMVAVKVQRPGIREVIFKDLEMFEEVATFLDKSKLLGQHKHYYWQEKVKILRTLFLRELDFKKEAQNLSIFKRNMKEFSLLLVPSPVGDYTTSRILTMEYIESKKITTLHPLILMDVDGEKLAKELFGAYLKQIFIDGFVHLDPHPGNIYITDTQQLALLDLGMVDYISPLLQQDLLKLLLSINEREGDEATDLLIKLGHPEEEFNDFEFREAIIEIIAQNQSERWEEIAYGKLLLKLFTIAGAAGLRLPPKFTSFGKTLTNLDMVVRKLAPTFNANAFITEKLENIFSAKIDKVTSKENLYRAFLEVLDLAQRLPHFITTILDKLSKNQFQIQLKTIDEHRLMRGIEKLANRIALGLVLSALIVGAALLMRVETSFKLLGYPGLAILFFFFAAFGGLLFILNILFTDEKRKK